MRKQNYSYYSNFFQLENDTISFNKQISFNKDYENFSS